VHHFGAKQHQLRQDSSQSGTATFGLHNSYKMVFSNSFLPGICDSWQSAVLLCCLVGPTALDVQTTAALEASSGITANPTTSTIAAMSTLTDGSATVPCKGSTGAACRRLVHGFCICCYAFLTALHEFVAHKVVAVRVAVLFPGSLL